MDVFYAKFQGLNENMTLITKMQKFEINDKVLWHLISRYYSWKAANSLWYFKL